jgi:hypothetical protein
LPIHSHPELALSAIKATCPLFGQYPMKQVPEPTLY